MADGAPSAAAPAPLTAVALKRCDVGRGLRRAAVGGEPEWRPPTDAGRAHHNRSLPSAASAPPPTPPRPPSSRPRQPSSDLDDETSVWTTLAGAGLVAASAAPRRRAAAVVPVPHVRQASTWGERKRCGVGGSAGRAAGHRADCPPPSPDCGLACVLMVLRAAGAPPALDLDALKADVGTESVWTIDLAHALARRGVPATLTTLTVGAPNPAYAGEAFYGPTLDADAPRVAALFSGAAAAGVVVERRSLTAVCLAAFLAAGDSVVVVLVDRRALARPPPSRTPSPVGGASAGAAPPHATASPDGGYMGHYVLLVGHDPADDTFAVRDPAGGPALARVPAPALDAARSAFGTDEDLLLIRLPSRSRSRSRKRRSSEEGGGALSALPASVSVAG